MFGLRTTAARPHGTLYAALNTTNGLQTIPLPARLIGTAHRYRIDWSSTGFTFSVDGKPKLARCKAAIPLMRLRARDTAADGSPLTMDWVRLSGYGGSGSRVSRVLDAHQMVTWDRLTYTADIPAGATLRVSVRTGSTAKPDSTWSAWTPVASGGRVVGDSRYLQYRVDMSTTVPSNTPVLRDIGITNNGTALQPAHGNTELTGTNGGGPAACTRSGTAHRRGDTDGGQHRRFRVPFRVSPTKLATATGLMLLCQALAATGAAAATAPGDLVLVSAAAGGEPGNGPSSYGLSTSADGRYVAFASMATNLDPGDTDTVVDVFVKDLSTGQVQLASQTAAGVKGTAISERPSISADGQTVAFVSAADNLSPDDTDGYPDVFVKNLRTGDLTVASRTADGIKAATGGESATVSADGSTVAFSSTATNLSPDAADGGSHVYVKRLDTGTLTLVDGGTITRPDEQHGADAPVAVRRRPHRRVHHRRRAARPGRHRPTRRHLRPGPRLG